MYVYFYLFIYLFSGKPINILHIVYIFHGAAVIRSKWHADQKSNDQFFLLLRPSAYTR